MSLGEASSEWEKIGTIIGRSLAFLCLQSTDVKTGTLLAKADFLSGLGLPYTDAARILGTTTASLNELARQAKNAKGKKNAKEVKAKSKSKR